MNKSDGLSLAEERRELIDAIGREIQRIDALAQIKGYSVWAIWGTMGVLMWTAINLLQSGIDIFNVFRNYIFLMFVGMEFVFALNFASSMAKKTNDRYFKISGVSRSSMNICLHSIFLFVFCLWIITKHNFGSLYLVPVVFLVFLICVLIGRIVLGDVPIPVGESRDILKRPNFWISLFVLIINTWCIIDVSNLVDLTSFVAPDAELKIAILLFITTIVSLLIHVQTFSSEFRATFQRLETDTLLSKISISSSRERYENLVLGMGVSAAMRPWVDAVALRLDEAISLVSELSQDMTALGGLDVDAAGERLAAMEKIVDKLSKSGRAVSRAKKAINKLNRVRFGIVSNVDYAEFPEVGRIVDTISRLVEAHEKVVVESKKVLPANI